MPLITSSPAHLPRIDGDPTPIALASAQTLIAQDLAATQLSTLHSSLPPLHAPQFSSLVDAEHAALDVGQPRVQGIDLSRYEALDAPTSNTPETWRATLQKAYASAEYLRGRETNLGLLESFGKNAWLIANAQLENVLKALEAEVEVQRIEVEGLERERREREEMVEGEFKGLESAWREGVGRLIEVLAAAEGVKGEVLERKRLGAT